MTPRVRSSLLWGLVGALAFLVSVQGYALAVAPFPLGVPGTAGVAVAVGGVVAGVAHFAEDRLRAKGRT